MNRTLSLLPLLALSLAACAASSHTTVDATLGAASSSDEVIAAAAEPGTVKLTRVVAADWAVPLSGLVNLEHPRAEAAGLEDEDEPIQIAFFVLEHPTAGTFIVDSGVAASFRNEDTAPVSWLVGSAMGMEKLHVRQDTAQWLEANGPIEGVFLTHLHLDHIMGLPDVPADVPVYAGPGEVEASSFQNMFTQGTTDGLIGRRGPLKSWAYTADPGGRFGGVVDVFGDGSVFAIHAPGHTPGTTAYLVRTPEGPHLIAGDTSHTTWGWEHNVEPGTFNGDPERAAASFEALQSFAAEIDGLVVHAGHKGHEEAATAAR